MEASFWQPDEPAAISNWEAVVAAIVLWKRVKG
jgi:hypothetical protein